MTFEDIQRGVTVARFIQDGAALARKLHGDNLPGKVKPYRDILEAIAKKEQRSTLMALKRALEIGEGKIRGGDEALFAAATLQMINEEAGICD